MGNTATIIEDLVSEYSGTNMAIKAGVYAQKNLSKENPTFKVGDIIEFWGGYNNDIRYRSKIIGFGRNMNEDIYVLWDCYWSPIHDIKSRKIVKV